MSIRISIDRLVLEGLPVEHGQAALVQAAVEAELATLFGHEQTQRTLASEATPALSASPITMQRDAGPAQLGRQIARAVYGGITR